MTVIFYHLLDKLLDSSVKLGYNGIKKLRQGVSTTQNKRITMGDIAGRLGISKNSVSLALNGKAGVSDELRSRIVEIAAEMGYGSYSAQNANKTKGIMVIIPEYLQNDTFFYADIFWMVEREIKKSGYLSLTTSISRDTEHRLLPPAIPRELEILGILLIGVVSRDYLSVLKGLGFPIVTVDITYPNSGLNSVSSANLSAAHTAVSYLIEHGHREIGFVGPIYTAQSIYERWCGFQQALLQNHLPIDPAYQILGEPDHFELFDTMPVLKPYLDRIERFPTAWFCAGDCIAIALINLLKERGKRVPGDISVVGFDDISVSELVRPALTTIHINRKLMGKLAVQKLIEASRNPHYEPVDLHLPGTIVVRDSVAARP